MRSGTFALQGFRENLVDAITSQLSEPVGNKAFSLMCVPGYAAGLPRNPAKLLSTSRWASQ